MVPRAQPLPSVVAGGWYQKWGGLMLIDVEGGGTVSDGKTARH